MLGFYNIGTLIISNRVLAPIMLKLDEDSPRWYGQSLRPLYYEPEWLRF